MNNKYKIFNKYFILFFIFSSVCFYIRFAFNNYSSIPKINYNIYLFIAIFTSIILVALMAFIGGVIWYLLLKDSSFNITLKQAEYIFTVSQIGKYLPGNVGHHLGRAVMAAKINVPAKVTINTIIFEICTGAFVGFLLAMAAFVFFINKNFINNSINNKILLTIVLIITLFIILYFLYKYLKKTHTNFLIYLKNFIAIKVQMNTFFIICVLYLFGFIIMGIIIKIQAKFFFGIINCRVIELTCLFSIAWIAGFLVPGAPGGLGVRETMMLLVLSPVLGVGATVGLGVTIRITTTIGDAIAFLLGLLVLNEKHKK